MKSRDYVTLGAALVALACSSRDVPSTFPNASPASPSAAQAPHAEVTRSLLEDPPLPGAPAEGWAGLATEESPAKAHDHAAAYACPMHPEVTSNEPGTCPKCGMKLEARK